METHPRGFARPSAKTSPPQRGPLEPGPRLVAAHSSTMTGSIPSLYRRRPARYRRGDENPGRDVTRTVMTSWPFVQEGAALCDTRADSDDFLPRIVATAKDHRRFRQNPKHHGSFESDSERADTAAECRSGESSHRPRRPAGCVRTLPGCAPVAVHARGCARAFRDDVARSARQDASRHLRIRDRSRTPKAVSNCDRVPFRRPAEAALRIGDAIDHFREAQLLSRERLPARAVTQRFDSRIRAKRAPASRVSAAATRTLKMRSSRRRLTGLRDAKTKERASVEALRFDRVRSSEMHSSNRATKKPESAILAPGARRRSLLVPIAFLTRRPDSTATGGLAAFFESGFSLVFPQYSSLSRRCESPRSMRSRTAAAESGLASTLEKIIGVVYEDRVSHARRRLAFNPLFVQIGLRHNTEWLVDTVTLSPRGETTANERVRSSSLAAFATGDATMESHGAVAATKRVTPGPAPRRSTADSALHRLGSSTQRTRTRAV